MHRQDAKKKGCVDYTQISHTNILHNCVRSVTEKSPAKTKLKCGARMKQAQSQVSCCKRPPHVFIGNVG